MACDFVINSHLLSAGFAIGGDWLYDPQYDGMSEEEVYDHLNQHPEDQPEDSCACGGLEDHPSTGQGEQGEEQSSDGDYQDGEDEDGDGNGAGEQQSQDGSDRPQHGGATPAIGQTEADIRMEVSQARAFAHAQAGLLPGDMERAVEQLLNPKIRPEEVLQQFMEQCAADDFSWLSPDRRFLNHGMYLPGMQSEGVREFVIAIDASGSVNQPMYDHFAAIMSKIAQDLPFETLHVLFCDTAVRKSDTYCKAELPIDCTVKGAGGGTRFSPVFQHLEREGIQPSGLVYLTDLICHDFPTPPSYKVLWLVDGRRDEVPFGDVLNVENFR
jgi:predicted metal-dependent peptidase